MYKLHKILAVTRPHYVAAVAGVASAVGVSRSLEVMTAERVARSSFS